MKYVVVKSCFPFFYHNFVKHKNSHYTLTYLLTYLFQVAQATILPKSTLAGITDITSKMLNAESKKQAYFFDYVTKVPEQPETHFRTIFSLATGAAGGLGNVLVSITAQTPEANYETMKPLFDKVIESYKG